MKAALYSRFSPTDGQQGCRSQMALREYCKANGWEVVAEYQDRNGRQRPQFLKAVEDGKRGRYSVLVFPSLDSLGRSGSAAAIQTLYQLSLCGIRLLSVGEPYLDTAQESIVALICGLANLENQRIRQRVQIGVANARLAGVPFGRPRLSIDRNAIQAMRQSGASLRQIAKAHGISVPTVVRNLSQVG
ncbi:MAG: recombinase family protein [Bryobacterales bacterium]|nr:recombinase family protein [Bryobacterales bacterium]